MGIIAEVAGGREGWREERGGNKEQRRVPDDSNLPFIDIRVLG
jgi:hypothetical protein